MQRLGRTDHFHRRSDGLWQTGISYVHKKAPALRRLVKVEFYDLDCLIRSFLL